MLIELCGGGGSGGGGGGSSGGGGGSGIVGLLWWWDCGVGMVVGLWGCCGGGIVGLLCWFWLLLFFDCCFCCCGGCDGIVAVLVVRVLVVIWCGFSGGFDCCVSLVVIHASIRLTHPPIHPFTYSFIRLQSLPSTHP